MTPIEIRIKCLELAKGLSADPAQLVEKAKAFEAYLNEAEASQDKPQPAGPTGTLTLPGKKNR